MAVLSTPSSPPSLLNGWLGSSGVPVERRICTALGDTAGHCKGKQGKSRTPEAVSYLCRDWPQPVSDLSPPLHFPSVELSIPV